MKVSELIKALEGCDPEAKVYVYSEIDEGGDRANRVLLKEEAEKKLYFKADPAWVMGNPADNFVVIA